MGREARALQNLGGEVFVFHLIQKFFPYIGGHVNGAGIGGGDFLALLQHRFRVLIEIGRQSVVGRLQILEILQKAAAHDVGDAVQGIGEGGGVGDGQVVLPLHALGLTQLQQLQNGLVLILAGLQEAGVEGEVVGGAAGDHGLAVAVGNKAAGGLHRLRPGDGADGLGEVVVVIGDLDIKEQSQVDQ